MARSRAWAWACATLLSEGYNILSWLNFILRNVAMLCMSCIITLHGNQSFCLLSMSHDSLLRGVQGIGLTVVLQLLTDTQFSVGYLSPSSYHSASQKWFRKSMEKSSASGGVFSKHTFSTRSLWMACTEVNVKHTVLNRASAAMLLTLVQPALTVQCTSLMIYLWYGCRTNLIFLGVYRNLLKSPEINEFFHQLFKPLAISVKGPNVFAAKADTLLRYQILFHRCMDFGWILML